MTIEEIENEERELLSVEPRECVLCGEDFTDFGNNPSPLAELNVDGSGQCCDKCNETKVLPARDRLLGH